MSKNSKENKQDKQKCDTKLNQRQLIFVETYLQTGNGRQSAIKAGYTAKNADVAACQILNSKKVQRYMNERRQKADKELIATTDEVLAYLTRVMRGQVKDQFELEPSLSDRTAAAKELAKRLVDRTDINNKVVINVNVPRSK